MPRLTILLLTSALVAVVVGASYTLYFNPETEFWKQTAIRKLAWVREMRAKHGYVIGVIGGSTTTFGIDAETIERAHHLPVANLGLHAGMGPDACVGFGLAALEQGDTLIVSFEPSMLTEEESEPTGLGVRLAWVLGKPELLDWGQASGNSWHRANPTKFQPGGYHVVTMLGKILLNQPLYRYEIKDSRPGGLQVTSERRPFTSSMKLSADSQQTTLSSSGRELLKAIRDEATRRGLRVAYLLPWAYWPENTADQRRAANDALLQQISEFMPVLSESNLGVHSAAQDFADSGQHLTAEAAAERSRIFCKTLQSAGMQPRIDN
jgi:hypothetical protein